jgi:uncharacterized protein involved in exopolysaccharide biosynthesis
METTKDLGVAYYLASIRRWRNLVLSIAVPILVGAGLLAITLPRAYEAPAQFRFEKAAIANGDQTAQDERNNYVDEYVSKLAESVLSSERLTKARTEFALYPEIAEPGAAVTAFKKAIHVDMLKEQFLDPESGHQKDVNSGFTVYYDARTPAGALKVSRWLADQFILVSRQNRRDRAAGTAVFLQGEADQYHTKIAELESKLAVFKQQHVGELPESAQTTIAEKQRIEQDLNNLEENLRALQQNRVFLVSQLQQVPAGNDEETLRQLQDEYARKKSMYDENHPDMIALRHQIDLLKRTNSMGAGNSLQAELASQKLMLEQIRQRYSDDHPDVKRLKRDIEALEARIASGEKSSSKPVIPTNPIAVQLQTQLSGTDNQIASMRLRKEELQAQLRQVENRVLSSPQVEKLYQVMMHDLELARGKYDEILKRKMEAEFTANASLAGSGDEFRMVAAPALPHAPAKPPRAGIVLVGLILALMLSIGAALTAEAFDSSVRGSRDLAGILGLAPLAVVPQIHNSLYHRKRVRQAAALATYLACGIPALYLLIRVFAR